MSIRHNILEAIKYDRDDFYYLCNDVEQTLFKLKSMTDNNDVIKKLEQIILELNNIRMDEYKRTAVVKNYIDLPFDDFRASNTIGELKDGRIFMVFDDNDVHIVTSKKTIEDIKNIIYSTDEDSFNEFAEAELEECDEDLANQILIEVNRYR